MRNTAVTLAITLAIKCPFNLIVRDILNLLESNTEQHFESSMKIASTLLLNFILLSIERNNDHNSPITSSSNISNFSYLIRIASFAIKIIIQTNTRNHKVGSNTNNDLDLQLKLQAAIDLLSIASISYGLMMRSMENTINNESDIILYTMKSLGNVKREVTHCVDWNRMTSRTSPHIFKEFSKRDLDFINHFLRENKYTMFLRKVDPTFPDDILLNYIYNQDIDNTLIQKRKYHLKFLEYKIYFMRFIKKNFFSLILLIAYYYFYKFVLLENNK